MAISRELKIIINGKTAKFDKGDVYLYQGDKNIDFNIEIIDNEHKYDKETKGNILRVMEGPFTATIKIVKPDKTRLTVENVSIVNGKLTFRITSDLIDELDEVGVHYMQIYIHAGNADKHIPPVNFEVIEPLFVEDGPSFNNDAKVGIDHVGMCSVAKDEVRYGLRSNGDYVVTNWATGDLITAAKLNKIETKLKELDTSIVNKAPASHTHTKAQITNFSHRHDASEIDNLPTSGGGSGVTKEYVDTQDNVLNGKISSLATEVKDDLLEGKKFRWKTKDEFNALSKEEQEDPSIEYHITDAEDTEAVDLSLNGNTLKLKTKDGNTLGTGVTLPSGGGSSVTVENNLTSTSTTNALSAAQGKVLKDEITVLTGNVGDLSRLNTTNKSNLVDVINELLALINDNPLPPNVSVESVTLDKTNLNINVGDVATLIHTITPSNATNKNVTWSTSDSNKVNIDNGLVTALAEGTATITVTTVDGNKTASCNVNVKTPTMNGVDISYLVLERDSNQLVMPTNICEVDTATIGAHNDVVHPCVLYFENSWNGYKYWMAVTPYPKTQSAHENPCMIVSNDGDTWTTIGKVPIYGIMDGAAHNSDCYIFMDGSTMVYLNRGATSNSCMIEYFTSTDGINWSERTKIVDAGSHNYLSPSICKYNNKYYMFVFDCSKNTGDDKKRITVLESATLDGTWNEVNKILVTNVSEMWHLEVKYIDGEFVALIMTGAAAGGSLSLAKFNTPLDSTVSVGLINPVVTANNGQYEKVLYKSTFIKKDNVVELFVNSKSTGNLDAFCHWTLNRSKLVIPPTNDTVGNDFVVNRNISLNDMVDVSASFMIAKLEHNNYMYEFTVSDISSANIQLKSLGSTQYCCLSITNSTCAMEYWKGGQRKVSIPILCNITKDTVFKFISKDFILSLYIDNRFIGSIDESAITPSCDLYARGIGYKKDSVGVPENIKVSLRTEDSVNVASAISKLEGLKTEYITSPQNFLAYDNFERANGAIGSTVCGKEWTTDVTGFTINGNAASGNMNDTSVIELSSGDYNMMVDLIPNFNHRVYVKYEDKDNNIYLAFNNSDKPSLCVRVAGVETKTNYNVFNTTNVRDIADIKMVGNKLSLTYNNQHIFDYTITNFTNNNKVGLGARLASTKFDSIIVKKI